MSTVNLEQGCNYHILNNGVNFCVEYLKDGKIYRKDILESNVTKPSVVDYCDERIITKNGNVLKRVRDNLSIEKE
ncbi:MAG: hypothetical protein IKV61_05320 [Clostridia bacterium]|nr:hypothetical protein [Clostridia bacterium]